MSDVIEQGATKWFRPSDYGGPSPNWNGAGDRRRPSGLPEPKYPRNPRPAPGKRVPGVTPKWSPISPNPLRPKLPGRPGGGALPIPSGRVPVGPGMGGMLGKIVPGIGFGLGVAGLLDDFFRPPTWYPVPNPANGWVFYGRCWLPAQAYLSSSETKGVNNNCLGGQALIGVTSPPIAPSATATRWTVWSHPKPIGLGVYGRHVESWTRTLTSNPGPLTVPRVAPIVNPMPNPNYSRGMPSLDPRADPLTDPQAQPDAQPLPDPDASSSGDNGYQGRAITPDGVKPIPPRLRVPPRPREREKKSMTRSKRILIALFKVLDETSEVADLVDALYEALPQHTRDKWKCNRSTPFLDNAGQYGIDNADCKAKALWHNWHNIDPELAVENIIKNHVYDMVVGGIHAGLPRNTGGALDDAFMSFDDFFSDFLDKAFDL